MRFVMLCLFALLTVALPVQAQLRTTSHGLTAPAVSWVTYWQESHDPLPTATLEDRTFVWCTHNEHDDPTDCESGEFCASACETKFMHSSGYVNEVGEYFSSTARMHFVIFYPNQSGLDGEWGGPADVNFDGVVNSQDFFDFITIWFSNTIGSDFNDDGAVNSSDLFDYLTAYYN